VTRSAISCGLTPQDKGTAERIATRTALRVTIRDIDARKNRGSGGSKRLVTSYRPSLELQAGHWFQPALERRASAALSCTAAEASLGRPE